MNRILFLVLWLLPVFQIQVCEAIEIYVSGHKYDSLQAYRDSKKTAVVHTATVKAALNNQQLDYIQKEAQRMGITVDLSKVKTFQVNQNNMSDKTLHKLYVLSVENGVVAALKDTYQAKDSNEPLDRNISSNQLQIAIQQVVTSSNLPKLLISQPGKVRIMALTTQETNN